MKSDSHQSYILRVTLGYAVFAALWIVFSDELLASFVDVAAMQWLSTAKGLLFVSVTTLLLFAALRGVPATGSEPSPLPLIFTTPTWPRPWVYGFAVVTSVAMLAVRSGLEVSFDERPLLIIFMFPIILSAMAGGFGPGLVSTLTAALGVYFVAAPPLHAFTFSQSHDLFQWGFLIVNGLLVSSLSEVLHRLRRQTEVARQQQTVTLTSIGDGVITTDTCGRITFVNREAQRLTGWTDREALGQPLDAVFKVVDENRIPVKDLVLRVLANGHAPMASRQALLLARDGRAVPIQESGAAIRLDDGVMLGVVLVFRDDTERLESEKTFRSLFDSTLNSVVHGRMIYQDGVPVDIEYLAVNPAFAKVTGIEEDVVGRRINEVIPGYGENNPESLAMFSQVALSGEPARWEHYLAALDRWFSFSIYSPAHGEVVIIADDISERKKTELALRESEGRFRQLFAVVPVPLCFVNRDGVLVDFNERFAETFGYSREELPDLDAWWRLAYPDPAYRLWVLTTWESAVRRAAEEKADIETMEYRVTCKNGEVRTMLISGVTIGDDFLATFIDVTGSRRIEQELRDSLSEKIVLLKEVHHRVKNNLQIVASLLSLQADRMVNPDVVSALHDTRNRVRSMALLHETLYLSGNLARIDFPAYISDLCSQLLRSFGQTATRVRVEEHIAALGMSMEQAVPCGLIVNELVSNALKHGFPEGRSGWVRIELGPDDSRQLILRVSDNGVGLKAGFDAAGTATLGLLLVRNLAGQLGGQLSVETPPAGGVVFLVIFPLPKEISFGGPS